MIDETLDKSLRFHLNISIAQVEDCACLKVFGWICCRVDVFKLTLHIDRMIFPAPVGFPRPDVHKAINQGRGYRFANSYFCGIDSKFNLSSLELSNISHLECNACISEKSETIIANVPFKFNSKGEASLQR